jgi:hypothetical protein
MRRRPRRSRTAHDRAVRGAAIEIEDIDALRRQRGIRDIALQRAIRVLRVGDYVKLTLKTGAEAFHGETILVRITSIGDRGFCGRLAQRPAATIFGHLRVGSPLRFTAAHIHSLAKEGPDSE